MSDADLYHTDIVGWSEEQAARLRRIAGGERPNDVGVDWPRVIEEIEAVGRSERRAVVSQLEIALLHVLKAYGWPDHRDHRHWMAEATTALVNMRAAVDPGMGQRLDLGAAYTRARRTVELVQVAGRAPRRLPRELPLEFKDLGEDAQLSALELLGRITAAAEDEADPA